jgi:arylsulfatase A-like enzyme
MNVLVLCLDTVRPDSLSVNGHPRCETPTLDRLAREGAIFDNAYAEFPVTVPTRTALLAGIYTFTNRPWMPMRSYDLHVAEVLQAQGWHTAAFSDSPFRANVGMERGFDEFHEFPGKLQPPDDRPDRPLDSRDAAFPPGAADEERLWRNCVEGFLDAFPRKLGRIGIELLVDEAIDWIDRHCDGPGADGRPFFAWLDTFQPHEPWVPPAPYDTRYQRPGYDGRFIPMPAGPAIDWMTDDEVDHVHNLYLGEVAYTDLHLARLIDRLDQRGLTEDTFVFVVSDHGQPMGEHGTIRKFGVPLYDELAKVTWIMRKPGLVSEGLRSPALVQTPDFLPTVLEACGVDVPAVSNPARMDGTSIVPLLTGQSDAIRDTAYFGAFGLHAGIRRGDWKLIDNRGERGNELYDLAGDPGERVNRLADEPDLAADLHRALWEFQSQWSSILAWRDNPAQRS